MDKLRKALTELSQQLDKLDRATVYGAYTRGSISGRFKLAEEIRAVRQDVERELLEIDSKYKIVRQLIFPPEYRQAGMSILSYFSSFLEHQYPGENTHVTIEQEFPYVRLIVSTAAKSNVEKIEKSLTNYALIITGKEAPENVLTDPLHVLEIKQRLQMSQLEVRMTKELLEETRRLSEERIMSLESQVNNLNAIVMSGLSREGALIALFEKLSKSDNYRDISAQLLKIENALRQKKKYSRRDIEKAASDIRVKHPSIFAEIVSIMRDTAAGAGGNVVAQWIVALAGTLPRV